MAAKDYPRKICDEKISCGWVSEPAQKWLKNNPAPKGSWVQPYTAKPPPSIPKARVCAWPPPAGGALPLLRSSPWSPELSTLHVDRSTNNALLLLLLLFLPTLPPCLIALVVRSPFSSALCLQQQRIGTSQCDSHPVRPPPVV